jgi:hypothetical protein
VVEDRAEGELSGWVSLDDGVGEKGCRCCSLAAAAFVAAAAVPLLMSYRDRRRLAKTHSSHVDSMSGGTNLSQAAANGPLLMAMIAAVHASLPLGVGVDHEEIEREGTDDERTVR